MSIFYEKFLSKNFALVLHAECFRCGGSHAFRVCFGAVHGSVRVLHGEQRFVYELSSSVPRESQLPKTHCGALLETM